MQARKLNFSDLISAAKAGTIETVLKYILERSEEEIKKELSRLDSYGNSALSYAAYYNHLNIVKLLVEKGASVAGINPKMRNSSNREQLSYINLSDVAAAGHAKMIIFLASIPGIEVDKNDRYPHITSLVYMARGGHADAVEALINAGANVNLHSAISYNVGDDWTPLMSAAWHGHKNVVSVLLNTSKIKLELTDKQGNTAAQLAEEKNHIEIFKLINDAMELKKSVCTSNTSVPTSSVKPENQSINKPVTKPATSQSEPKPATQIKSVSMPAVQSATDSTAGRQEVVDCINIGRKHANNGKFDVALNYFQQAITLDPANVKAYDEIACTFFNLGDFQNAEKHFQYLCRLLPDEISFTNLGNTQRELEKYDEAEKSLVKALQLNQNVCETHGLLGKIYCHQNKYSHAISEFNIAIQLGSVSAIYSRLKMHEHKQGLKLTNTEISELYKKLLKNFNRADRHVATLILKRLELKEIYLQLISNSQSAQTLPATLQVLEKQEKKIFELEKAILEMPVHYSHKSVPALSALVNRLLYYPLDWKEINNKKPDFLSLNRCDLHLIESVSINDILDHLERQAMKQKYVESVKDHLVAYQAFIEKFAETWKKSGWIVTTYDTSEIAAIRNALNKMNISDAENILSVYVIVINKLASIEKNKSYSPHLRSCATQMKNQLVQIRLTHQPDTVKVPETDQYAEDTLFYVPTEAITKAGKQPLILDSTASMLYATRAAQGVDPLTPSAPPPYYAHSVSSYEAPPPYYPPSVPSYEAPPPYVPINAPVATQPAYNTQSWPYGSLALSNALPSVPTAPLQYYTLFAMPPVPESRPEQAPVSRSMLPG